MQSKIRVYESGRAEQVILLFLHLEVTFVSDVGICDMCYLTWLWFNIRF